MSHQDDIEECLESFFDMMENCQNDSLRTSTPNFLDEVGSSDNTLSTSEAVDPDDGGFDEPSHPTKKAHTTVCIDPDFFGDPCETSGSGSLYSVELLYPWLRRRPGIRGFIDGIPYQMRVARERGYLLPFELIWMGFTLLCCFIGAQYWTMCRANAYVPRYVFFNGAIATFSACVQVMDSLWKCTFRRYSDMWKCLCAFGIGWVAVIGTFFEMTEFYTMSYSFSWYETNYCDENFYWFVYYKNIAFGVLVSLAALIYIPGFDFHYYYREFM